MRILLGRIRCVLSDWGVESYIVNSPDILPDVFRALAKPSSRSAMEFPRQTWLLPSAFFMPGWQHIMDNIIKYTLSMMEMFPRLLSEIKAIVAFLRIESHCTILAKGVPEHTALYKALTGSLKASFAKWRWDTLYECLKAIIKLQDLGTVWRRSKFNNSQDTVSVDVIDGAMNRPSFWCELYVVVLSDTD